MRIFWTKSRLSIWSPSRSLKQAYSIDRISRRRLPTEKYQNKNLSNHLPFKKQLRCLHFQLKSVFLFDFWVWIDRNEIAERINVEWKLWTKNCRAEPMIWRSFFTFLKVRLKPTSSKANRWYSHRNRYGIEHPKGCGGGVWLVGWKCFGDGPCDAGRLDHCLQQQFDLGRESTGHQTVSSVRHHWDDKLRDDHLQDERWEPTD